MSGTPSHGQDPGLEAEAAAWAWRRECGLTAAEERTFAEWLAENPRHGAELARLEGHWRRLDRLLASAPRPGARSRVIRLTFASLAAAAGLAWLVAAHWRPAADRGPGGAGTRPPELSEIEDRTLADGSTVELNRGAAVAVRYGPAERRVELTRGEAQFHVAKDARHPFIVEAAGVRVRAVGTAFDVRIGPKEVSVVVTEGTVQVTGPGGEGRVPQVTVGEELVVPRQRRAPLPAPVRLTAPALQAELAWQPQRLNFTGVALAEIVQEFNRHNPIRLVVEDPELARLRLTARLRSDNVSGFVRMLETGCGVHAERRSEGEIVLKKDR